MSSSCWNTQMSKRRARGSRAAAGGPIRVVAWGTRRNNRGGISWERNKKDHFNFQRHGRTGRTHYGSGEGCPTKPTILRGRFTTLRIHEGDPGIDVSRVFNKRTFPEMSARQANWGDCHAMPHALFIDRNFRRFRNNIERTRRPLLTLPPGTYERTTPLAGLTGGG